MRSLIRNADDPLGGIGGSRCGWMSAARTSRASRMSGRIAVLLTKPSSRLS
jgi:hypothetical protein